MSGCWHLRHPKKELEAIFETANAQLRKKAIHSIFTSFAPSFHTVRMPT